MTKGELRAQEYRARARDALSSAEAATLGKELRPYGPRAAR
jgi:hypothetical protein